jgi:polysaccharide export outer membrane protein
VTKKIFLFALTIFLLSSCTQRSLRYIQDKKQDKLDTVAEYTNQPPDYLIQPYDVLYIKITTTNAEVNTLFEENITSNYTQNNSGSNQNNDANFYFTGFMVTDSGWVKVPLLGDFYVKDETIEQIENKINDKVKELLIDAIIKVKLISFKVYFLGEVNGSSSYTFYQKNVNLLEAISTVGGINDYGDKKKIMIIRKINDGFKVYRVDLTDRKILESENFYLQPNDMVYVEPVKLKGIQLALTDFLLPLSALSTTISTVLLILSLKQ